MVQRAWLQSSARSQGEGNRSGQSGSSKVHSPQHTFSHCTSTFGSNAFSRSTNAFGTSAFHTGNRAQSGGNHAFKDHDEARSGSTHAVSSSSDDRAGTQA